MRPFATPEAEAEHLVERIRRRRVPARGDRDPVPHARAARRLRGRARTRRASRHQGARCSRARRRAACCARSTRGSAPAEQVRQIALDLGWLPHPPDKLGEREQTRQSDLARLVRLAEETRRHRRGVPGRARASASATAATPGEASTCSPTTAPRASSSRSCSCRGSRRRSCPRSTRARHAEIEEERRLLYVGLTRAKQGLAVTLGRQAEPLPRRADARGGRRRSRRRASRR